MIIGCASRLIVGSRLVGISDDHGVYHHDQPFVVLREATADEFIADRNEDGEPMKPSQVAYIQSGKGFFYEISLD